jgi:hypothetical protein
VFSTARNTRLVETSEPASTLVHSVKKKKKKTQKNSHILLGLLRYSAFTLDVKPMLNENLGGILGGTQC